VYKEDLESYFTSTDHAAFVTGVSYNTKRYETLFKESVDKLMPLPSVALSNTVEQVLLNQRLLGDQSQLPSEYKRQYTLVFCYRNLPKAQKTPLRLILGDHIGTLITVRGIVTRMSDVKPMNTIVCYVCELCGKETYQVVTGRTFNQLGECASSTCKENSSKGRLFMTTRGSKLVQYQEFKIQEASDQVPMGQVPRHMKIQAYGDCVRKCTAGDSVTITGVYLPMPYATKRGQRVGLIHDTYLEVYQIEKQKKPYADTSISREQIDEFLVTRSQQDLYDQLAKSIAPEIHGHLDVKKALLLMLVGGVTKEMSDGMKIRGDINVLLMGDPGVAKSQLLKHITTLSPRAVYTTGKGSSGVGLTAAVVKDPVTREMLLEGGALVIADQGICCIDEFDKMDERDRTAIHEVMEQQTVSIAKAGITTTLNARTSILAAANPIYSRYDRKKTPHENINLPAALLSRFDLVFLILDKSDREVDLMLARHITSVHRTHKAPDLGFIPFDANLMRAYVAEAKRFEPIIPRHVHDHIVEQYLLKRHQQTQVSKAGYMYVTPRTLLGIIRLAQGLARLRFSQEVDENDIREALRLMDSSHASVNDDSQSLEDPQTKVYVMLKEMCQLAPNFTVEYPTALKRLELQGVSAEQLKECLDVYSELNVLYVHTDGSRITLVKD
jgi:DNA replication licensing factor MCM7